MVTNEHSVELMICYTRTAWALDAEPDTLVSSDTLVTKLLLSSSSLEINKFPSHTSHKICTHLQPRSGKLKKRPKRWPLNFSGKKSWSGPITKFCVKTWRLELNLSFPITSAGRGEPREETRWSAGRFCSV